MCTEGLDNHYEWQGMYSFFVKFGGGLQNEEICDINVVHSINAPISPQTCEINELEERQ